MPTGKFVDRAPLITPVTVRNAAQSLLVPHATTRHFGRVLTTMGVLPVSHTKKGTLVSTNQSPTKQSFLSRAEPLSGLSLSKNEGIHVLLFVQGNHEHCCSRAAQRRAGFASSATLQAPPSNNASHYA